ncbi:CHAT domain-containing protein [Candidatus Protochlamydia amoebophila]|uniref:CHAT domain-containing protein n=1 Tax=Protochlamydia amoebophila (strain UWE25) TaxID=264201 RepID=Q6MF80_PARUW|nr:CHAT domain-containing protein [Candidatus Protochlamydia amoebophila]CAF22769.1 unnamed protein product [Candidatus Protochlamydia amoebophila UWE25]
MNVDSVKFSAPYYLHYPLLPTISLLDHVKGLIEAYKTKSSSEEDIFFSVKLLLEEINQLEDIGIKRECLCRLLKIEREEIQNLIVEEAMPLFNHKTIPYDIQHNQAQQLVELEEIVSEIIEAKLTSGQFNFLVPICEIYQGILEHLWLLPYFEFGNHCSHLLIQNKGAILSHMERWKDSLDQLASEEKINRFIPKNLEKAVLRLFEPLPKDIAKKIEEKKSVIHESGVISLMLLDIMMKICSDQGDFPRAIFHAKVFLKMLKQKLLEISQKEEILVRNIQKGEILVGIMHMHDKIAGWNQFLKQYPRAIDHSKKALRIVKTLGTPYEIITHLKNMGYLYIAQGKNKDAIPFYQEALSIAQNLKDSENESKILGCLAEIYFVIDNNAEAIRYYQDALKLTEEKSEQALNYSGIGEAYASAQQYKEAEEAYKKALEILSQVNNPFFAIIIHERLATFFKGLGRYEKVIYHAEKILELIQHPSVQVDELQAQESKFDALTTLGNIYGTLGDRAREIDYFTQAVNFAEEIKVHLNHLGIAYANLGSAYFYEGNYFEGIKCYNKTSEILKVDSKRAKILRNMGQILFSSGMFSEAIEYYEEANRIGNQDTKKDSLLGLGASYNALGNKKQAIQNIGKFICLSQTSKNSLDEALGYYNLGLVYKEFDFGLAEENYCKSIEIYFLLYRELKNHSQWQITFFEKQALPFLRLESLLLEQAKNEQALQVTDFRRSRALVSALTEKFQFQKDDSLISSGLTAQEMQAFAHKMNTCFIVYSRCFENADSIAVWVIPSQGEITCQQLFLGNLAEEVNEATQVFKTFPFIVEPTVAKRRPFIRPKKTRSSATYASLDELTRGVPDESANSAVLQSFKERLSLWYEALIAPLESYLPKDPQQIVTIIPDGFLAQIPFAAFLDKEGTYLIEKHPISIAPSMGILKLLDEIPKVFSKSSLVIGNPRTLHSKDALPLAEKEAQTIVAPLLKTTSERILLQDSATVQHVVERMRDVRWIHLACHGLTGTKPEEKLDPHSVFEGLFKLAPDESHSRGYLHAQEIASLTLRTELVFMSACFSGRGKLHREGSVGPVWSFLAAGALSTVATYWRLPDSDLTLQMVDTFYRHLLGIGLEKLNKAQALQKAMLVGIEQKRDKPHLWGAFFLSGLHE